MRHHVPGIVDVKILRAPALDVVKRACRVNVPRRWRRSTSVGLFIKYGSDQRIMKSSAQKSTNRLKNLCPAHFWRPRPRHIEILHWALDVGCLRGRGSAARPRFGCWHFSVPPVPPFPFRPCPAQYLPPSAPQSQIPLRQTVFLLRPLLCLRLHGRLPPLMRLRQLLSGSFHPARPNPPDPP